MVSRITVEVSFSQLAVFASSLPKPFNDWTDQHVAQGFAWRPGSVSFRTMSEASLHVVSIEVVDRLGVVHPEAVRALEVPFEVPADGAIEVGSIAGTVPVALPTGPFLLRCEFLRSTADDGGRVRLTFAKKDEPRFSVVRADPDLAVVGELLITAEPAPG